jgi:hypothetical protein
MTRRLRCIAAAALVLGLAGCSSVGAGGSSSGADGGGAGEPGVAQPGVVQPGAAGGEDSGRRDVIVTGELSVISPDPLKAADDARKIVQAAGGRLDGVTKQPANDFQDASAQLITRIPTDRLDATLSQLQDLGEVGSLTTSSSDVTQVTTDLDARISSLQASVGRLRDLIGSAADTADLIAIEKALSDREAELESLTAQRNRLGDQVDYATITVSFTTPAAAPDSAPTDFWGAVAAGFGALMAALTAAGLAFGAALPWLIFLGLLALLVLLAVRLLRGASRRARSVPPGADLPENPVARSR